MSLKKLAQGYKSNEWCKRESNADRLRGEPNSKLLPPQDRDYIFPKGTSRCKSFFAIKTFTILSVAQLLGFALGFKSY